jgi:predicted nucleic acid-binding protein
VSATAGTVVDSSVLLDLFTEDATWLTWSQARLVEAAERGSLVLNAVVLAEIAPRFSRIETLRDALPSMCLIEEIPLAASFLAGHAHAEYRRAGGTRQAILPDFLIGAHAAVTGRPLLTRDPTRIASYIPGANLISP